MSDDKKPNPDDDQIVTSLDEITAGGPVLWTSDAMVTQGGAIFAIPDDGARGSWREPWPSAEGKPKHMLWARMHAPPSDATRTEAARRVVLGPIDDEGEA